MTKTIKISAIRPTAWVCLLAGTLALTMPVPPASAQTVEECYAERDRLQQWIGEQEDQDAFEHVQAVIERADLAASEGDAKKCMELIKDADGSARALGGN